MFRNVDELSPHSLSFTSPYSHRVSHPPKQTMEFLCILLLCHISLIIFSIGIFHWDHRLLISYDWFFPNEQSSLFIIQTDVSVHGIRELAFSYTHQGCLFFIQELLSTIFFVILINLLRIIYIMINSFSYLLFLYTEIYHL